MNYWKNQQRYDLAFAVAITALFWKAPSIGAPELIKVSALDISNAARVWVGPLLTLVGMMSATTAFIFSVIDRGEFKEIKDTSSEGTLWKVFSQNLFWLAASAIMCVLLTFWAGNFFEFVAYIVSFFTSMACICLSKFTWVIRQIVSVRVSQAELRNQKK